MGWRVITMLRTIALVLFILWLLGLIGFAHALGAFVHILIIAAAVILLIDLLSGRPVL
jgi:hypothetical protein